MSLPWFAFNADAYVGDTHHLTTEEHGAYLLLMLAYYQSEKPLPASDRALASICKLTADRWSECKAALAPFFLHEDGCWRHLRIEAEIADGYAKVEKYTKRAKAGADARYGDRKRMQQASSNDAPIPLPKPIDSLSARANTVSEVVPSQSADEDQAEGAFKPLLDMSPVAASFQPPAEAWTECEAFIQPEAYAFEVQKFILHHQAQGSMSHDWTASFRIWMTRYRQFAEEQKARAAAKGRPRVEVNHAADAETKVNWDWHLERWLKNQSNWSRRTAGPEPGQAQCRVPVEMLLKHGIDPATGLRVRVTT